MPKGYPGKQRLSDYFTRVTARRYAASYKLTDEDMALVNRIKTEFKCTTAEAVRTCLQWGVAALDEEGER